MYDAICEAQTFVQKKNQRDIEQDRQLALSLTKEIEIAGEAASKVSAQFKKAHPEIPWKTITDTRNRLIHVYFDIDYDKAWEVIAQDFPKLKGQLKPLLKK